MSDEEKSFQQRVEEALAAGLPMPDFPDGGGTPLANLAAAQHEAVNEWEKAGFPRGEALYLVAAMFSNNPGLGPSH